MSDLIFYTNGEETSRIPFPTPGTKCPETKLEIKMTEIEKTEAEIKVLQKKLDLLKEIETHKSQPKMEYQESGTVDKVEYNGHTYLRIDYDNDSWYGGVWWKQIERHKSPMNIVTDNETRNILEGLWFNQVKKGVIDEPEHFTKNEGDATMTERNFTKELLYTYYADMENGDDVESIDYRSLIHIITELHNRIEKLEAKLND